MKKSKLNFIIDALMLLVMIAIVGLGFLIKYILLSGKERVVKYGRNVELFLFGLDRHQWGTVHLILGLILLGLLALHIILHWKVILCIYRRLINIGQLRRIIGLGFSIGCIVLLVVPFLLKPEIQELGQGEGHFGRNRDMKSYESIVSNDHFPGIGNLDEIHTHDSISINIAGFMTIGSVCTTYNIPPAHLIEKLGLSVNTTSGSTLGRLRRKYGFRMSDIKRIIENYHTKKADEEILK